MDIILELKLLADVGACGITQMLGRVYFAFFIVKIARPKIANYPFTTVEPSLGIVGYHDNKSS